MKSQAVWLILSMPNPRKDYDYSSTMMTIYKLYMILNFFATNKDNLLATTRSG